MKPQATRWPDFEQRRVLRMYRARGEHVYFPPRPPFQFAPDPRPIRARVSPWAVALYLMLTTAGLILTAKAIAVFAFGGAA